MTMANLHFSWSDSVQAAFSSCLFCFRNDDHEHEEEQNTSRPRTNGLSYIVPPPRARPDELEGLLADTDSLDAETLSLHSNFGDERRRKKRRKPRKGITLFGFNLFGQLPPIQLPESDDEEGASSRRTRTISTSTLDSDAAPLDASALDEQAIVRLAAATAAAEEEQRRAKEERRRLRRERKELKRMALAMAMGMQQQQPGEGFEGFHGSGPPLRSGPGSGSASVMSSPFAEDFGPFEQAEPEQLGDDADFGAEYYIRRAPHGKSPGGSASDSQSRTSASLSNPDTARYDHQYPLQVSLLSSPVLSAGVSLVDTPTKKKRRSSRAKSLSSKQSDEPARSTSSAVTSQSPSLLSPPAIDASLDHIASSVPPHAESDGRFEGFPGGTLDLAREHAIAQEDVKATDGFPSVGLRGIQRTKSDMGVFLANRGE